MVPSNFSFLLRGTRSGGVATNISWLPGDEFQIDPDLGVIAELQTNSKFLQSLELGFGAPKFDQHRGRQRRSVGGVGPEGAVALDEADQALGGEGRGEGGGDAD